MTVSSHRRGSTAGLSHFANGAGVDRLHSQEIGGRVAIVSTAVRWEQVSDGGNKCRIVRNKYRIALVSCSSTAGLSNFANGPGEDMAPRSVARPAYARIHEASHRS